MGIAERFLNDEEPEIHSHILDALVHEYMGASPGEDLSARAITLEVISGYLNPLDNVEDQAEIDQIKVHLQNGDYSIKHLCDVSFLATQKQLGYNTPQAVRDRLLIV